MKSIKNKFKIRNKTFAITVSTLIIFVLIITIGFASFSDQLSISAMAMVRVQADIRVTKVTAMNGTNGATTNWEEYHVKDITSSVNLPNANSTITYRIEVTNIGNVEQGIYAIDEIYKQASTNANSNLEIKSTTVNLKEALCDDSNSSKCKLGSVTTFDITIGYKNNGYDGTNITHSVELAFDFRRVFGITYEGFSGNTSGLPSTVTASGGTITFNNTSGIPANVTVTGATGNYTSPTLTLSNITGNVTITATFNGNVEVIDNGDGTTTTNTSTVTENPDGSTTTFINSVTTDSQGNTVSTSEIETVENTNGTSTTTTINYDAQGNKTTGSTSNTDTSGNINTQEVEYNAQGTPIVIGYTIDTSNNQNGGETISGGLDTGMIAFDGRAFTIHIKARVNPADQGTTNVFVSALENVSNNKYSGFTVDIYNKQSIISYGGTNTQIKNAYFGSRITGKVDNNTGAQELNYLKTGRQEIEINITYTPSILNPQWKYIINAKQLYTSTTSSTKQSEAKSTMYSNSGYLPQSLSNATVVVGSYGVEHTHDMVNYEILEFDVHKQ